MTEIQTTKMSVLVVDDDKSIGELCYRALTNHDLDVTVAEEGEEALRKIQKKKQEHQKNYLKLQNHFLILVIMKNQLNYYLQQQIEECQLHNMKLVYVINKEKE